MPNYYNPNDYDVHLSGPNGERITVRKRSNVILPSFFDKYVKGNDKILTKLSGKDSKRTIIPQKTVGRLKFVNYQTEFNKLIADYNYPMTEDIGIGILSYNRYSSLFRLINSIKKYSKIKNLNIFISDDGSDQQRLLNYLESLSSEFTILLNKTNLGIAGNTNRLLKCLARFRYKLLLNDDVEIINDNWHSFYFDVMQKTGFHHYCFRQPGVYGASAGRIANINDIKHSIVDVKPHGAVLALDDVAFNKLGYFDERFGKYGMEHVDWSSRVYKANLQPIGYFDVVDAAKYFKIHSEKSAVEDRIDKLQYSRKIKNDLIRIETKVEVPSISYVIPIRGKDRRRSLNTVINNVKSQHFPNIEIILVEHDCESYLKMDRVKYEFIKSKSLFNKSKCFNLGVSVTSFKDVILHDADMLVHDNYTNTIFKILSNYDSCHVCNNVYYLNERDTDIVNSDNKLNKNMSPNRCVTYFEGGTLACKKQSFIKIGGFAEVFEGYGCEDCEFYRRLVNNTKFYENRKYGLIHLHHGRTVDWHRHHKNNKDIESNLCRRKHKDLISELHGQLIRNYSW